MTDPSLEDLGRELDDLRRWKTETLEVLAGIRELGRAIDVPLGMLITGPEAIEFAARMRAERDALREGIDSMLKQRREASMVLASLADRLDEHSYDELSTVIDDEPSDHLGEPYVDSKAPGSDLAPWAIRYARDYWKHGTEPGTQAALTILTRRLVQAEAKKR